MPSPDFLETLMTLPRVLFARLSPDRRWLAYVWANVGANYDVYAVPADGSAAPVALTQTPELTWLVDWTPDARAVIVEEDHDGDERVALYRIDLERPGEMQRLTEDRPPYYIRGGQLLADGKTLLYGANYDFEKGAVIEPTWMVLHDLETGARRAIGRPAKPAYARPEANKAGTHVLYPRADRHAAGRQFHLIDLASGEDRELLHYGDHLKTTARWLDDATIVFTADTETHTRLGLHDLKTGQTRWLLDDPARAIEDFRITPGQTLVVEEIVNASRRPFVLDPAGGAETPFPRFPGNLLPLGQNTAGQWTGIHYAANRPPDLVRFMVNGHAEPTIFSLTGMWERARLTPGDLAPAESIAWAAPDGLEIQGWLYKAKPNPRRAVLYIHGGPTSHSESNLNPQIQYLVSQGFNVLDVNYRGSTGFGLEFRERIKEDGWGGREQDDIAAGARKLIEMGLAEPGRVGVTGTSYGGYSSWRQITRTPPEVIAAAVPICGMTDLVVDHDTTRPDLRPYSVEMMGGAPDEIPEKYAERSPINHVQNIKGALLIVQGGQDPNVTPENMRVVVQRLTEHDIPYELEVFEDEGHGIVRPANRIRLYRRMAEFFDRALGPA
ncbi:MAG: S9 family peptidase [Chloroflexi bacterium]|nr:S9 family peptidase [Chloroflexota bacterium]